MECPEELILEIVVLVVVSREYEIIYDLTFLGLIFICISSVSGSLVSLVVVASFAISGWNWSAEELDEANW